MRSYHLGLLILCAFSCGVPSAWCQPGAPVDVRLVARRTDYRVAKPDATGKSFCFVAIDVELRNTSKEGLSLKMAREPVLVLTGPRPSSVTKLTAAMFYVPQESVVSLPAGTVYRIELRTLAYSVDRARFQMVWHEPGDYVLQAIFAASGICGPKEKGVAERKIKVVAKSPPLKLTIREGSVSDYWADALSDVTVRRIALQNLADMGPAALSAAPTLVKLLADADAATRRQAVQTLAAVGPKSQPVALAALLQRLRDDDADVRRAAIAALAQVAPGEKAVVTALLPFLRHADAKTRIASAQALRLIHFTNRHIESAETEALLQALKAETDSEARRSLIAALAHHPQLEVLSVLIPHITAEDRATRLDTLEALSRIAPFLDRGDRKKNKQLGRPIENAVAALIEAMKDRETLPQAVHCLSYFSNDGALAVPALLDALDDPANQAKDVFSHPRVPILQALRGIGPAAKSATPALTARVASDPDYTVRQYAIQALAAIGPDAKSAIPVLKQALSDKMAQVRNEVAPALARIGAVDALLEGLDHNDAEARRLVIYTLAEFKTQAKQVAPRLAQQVIDDPDPLNRRSAASTLGSLGSAVEPVVANLGKALKDKDADVRLSAAEALGNLDGDAKAAIRPLVEAMKSDASPKVREKAGWSLVRINVQMQKAMVPELTRLLADPDQAVALPAIYLLGQLGQDAQDALPALQQAMRQPRLAEAARQAIRQIEARR